MGEAALELLRDEERRRRFGADGRRRALERFSEDEVVERYRGVYQRVLAGG